MASQNTSSGALPLGSVWVSAGFVIIVLFTRAVFYVDGFGSHPDEWRVIRSGVIFWLDGTYFPSRLPSYPFNEIIMGAAVLIGGPILCATLSTIVSAVAVLIFARLLALHAPESGAWPVLAFALQPWFWASGITALDPAWGLALLLAALLAVDTGKYFWSGFASGLAFGFRPTAALWGAVLFLRTIQKSRSVSAAVGFVVGAMIPLGIAAALYLSADIPEGKASAMSSLLQINIIQGIVLAAYRTVEFLGGIPVAITLLIISVVRMPKLREQIKKNFWSDWHLVAISILYLAQFVIISDKPEYLFPLLPLIFLVLARAIPQRDWMMLSAVFILSALVAIDFGAWGYAKKPTFDIKLVTGPVLQYRELIQRETAIAARHTATAHESESVIRAGRSHHVLQNAYVLALLRYCSQSDETLDERPVMAEIFRSSPDQPITVCEWSEIGRNKGSSAALYYPAVKKLYVNTEKVGTDAELLDAVQKWHRGYLEKRYEQ